MAVDKRRYSDRRRYLIAAVSARRKKVRLMAVAHKGGCCQLCGYDRCGEALEFHHSDLSGKQFGISEKGYTKSWDRVRDEIDKCVLVYSQLSPRASCEVSSLRWKRRSEKASKFRESPRSNRGSILSQAFRGREVDHGF